ncbi:DUF3853 family protein [Bergeyella cardium]|uniref:DUF3853 family protein n=1 Tax=Bergeyella cardium TaxID=1585976 RepID=A0A6P1QUX3_9FLAO|nr:DUF3853 family protein [Bergeyella cardium]QHN64601.1 DUF3853 family protein [Bergeyella cardium]WHE33894.1 DUF3853 family protein [Bergeyella cardium]WHF60544.1 DUF3853 family protein [Bergeyella cardium]
MNIDRDTPIWQLTLGEFIHALKNANEPPKTEQEPVRENKEYVHGISGLARLIGCSTSHAARLKGQGIFDEAIIQRGRKIIIDKEKALELFNNKK